MDKSTKSPIGAKKLKKKSWHFKKSKKIEQVEPSCESVNHFDNTTVVHFIAIDFAYVPGI